MNFGSPMYLLVPPDVKIVTTKGDIEGYVKQSICAHLDALLLNDCFQRQYDGSGYDMAIEDVRKCIDKRIKGLRKEIEKSDEGNEEDKE